MNRWMLLVLLAALIPLDADARTRPNPEGRLVLDAHDAPLPTTAAEPLRRANPVPLADGAVQIGETYYDLQDMGGLGKRIVIGDDGRVHVTWVDDFCELSAAGCPPDLNAPQPFPERTNAHAWRDAGGSWNAGVKVADPSIRGCCVTERFGGFGSMALTPDGRAVVVPHANEDGCDARASMYVQDAVGGATFSAYLTPITDPSFLFPQVVALADGSFTVLAEVAEFGTYDETEEFRVARLGAEGTGFSCPTGWQFGSWNPVVDDVSVFRDGTPAFPSIAAGDDGRVGIAVSDFGGNVFLYESSDGSFAPGTITVTTITSYTDAAITAPDASSDEYRAFVHSDLVYEGNTPHVVWAELQGRRDAGGVFFVDHRSRIMHWSPGDGISEVYRTAGEADAYGNVDVGGSGPLAGFNTISVDWPQVGSSADGSEVHVVWLRFVDAEVDPTADAGLPGIVTGIGYGDVVHARRLAAGSWSTPENLTNTPTADERFVSLAARNPNDRLHLVFQASTTDEAGVTAIGDRGFAGANVLRRIGYLEIPTGAATDVESAPMGVGALRVHPNPASRTVVFRLEGPASTPREVTVYSVDGRRVQTLRVDAGGTSWNAVAANGRPLASGVYFARVDGDSGPVTRFVIRR